VVLVQILILDIDFNFVTEHYNNIFWYLSNCVISGIISIIGLVIEEVNLVCISVKPKPVIFIIIIRALAIIVII
jgi:hypothetical protein